MKTNLDNFATKHNANIENKRSKKDSIESKLSIAKSALAFMPKRVKVTAFFIVSFVVFFTIYGFASCMLDIINLLK